MSAYVVSDNTIHAMMTFLFQGCHRDRVYAGNERMSYDPSDMAELTRMGQTLLNENYRSVNSRYKEESKAPEYKYKWVTLLSPVQILKLCDCYDYQACETDDYEITRAADIVRTIRDRAIRKLPGYESAQWDLPQ